jgi:hypothetical protein
MKTIAQLTNAAPSMIFWPMCPIKLYSEIMGMTVDGVRSQIKAGNLPTIRKGKYIYINLVALIKECTEAAEAEEAAISHAASR